MDKTDRLRDYGLAFLLYKQGLSVCGYELIRELFIFIKLILNSYLEIFIDTYMEQKKSPVNRTYFKITIPHPSVLKGYYGGIGFMFYGIMVILYYMI